MRLKKVKGALDYIEAHRKILHSKEEVEMLIKNKAKRVEIEIGMGKGDFILGKALENPEIVYIGIEKFDSVLVRALEKFDEMDSNLENVYFMLLDAEHIETYFDQSSVDVIYINFSDPWPKKRHAKRRLTASMFLKSYASVLTSFGYIEQKTDNTSLFESSVLSLSENKWKIEEFSLNLHEHEYLNEKNIETEYERRFAAAGHNILYLRARP